MLKFKDAWDDEYNVSLLVDKYANNSNIYIGIMIEPPSEDAGELYCDMTINVEKLPEGFACITNDVMGLEDFIKKSNIGKPTGKTVTSGFSTYPVYELNMDIINTHLFK